MPEWSPPEVVSCLPFPQRSRHRRPERHWPLDSRHVRSSRLRRCRQPPAHERRRHGFRGGTDVRSTARPGPSPFEPTCAPAPRYVRCSTPRGLPWAASGFSSTARGPRDDPRRDVPLMPGVRSLVQGRKTNWLEVTLLVTEQTGWRSVSCQPWKYSRRRARRAAPRAGCGSRRSCPLARAGSSPREHARRVLDPRVSRSAILARPATRERLCTPLPPGRRRPGRRDGARSLLSARLRLWDTPPLPALRSA